MYQVWQMLCWVQIIMHWFSEISCWCKQVCWLFQLYKHMSWKSPFIWDLWFQDKETGDRPVTACIYYRFTDPALRNILHYQGTGEKNAGPHSFIHCEGIQNLSGLSAWSRVNGRIQQALYSLLIMYNSMSWQSSETGSKGIRYCRINATGYGLSQKFLLL